MENCIFCKIASRQMPAHILHEDELLLVILDAFPLAKGHMLIIPKNHAQNLLDLPEETAAAIMPLAQKFAQKLSHVLGCDGINILQNNGAAAGQVVMHYHLHIIPRYNNEKESVIKFSKSLNLTPEELTETKRLLTEE
jgi:histidine triad (HIT) family protein